MNLKYVFPIEEWTSWKFVVINLNRFVVLDMLVCIFEVKLIFDGETHGSYNMVHSKLSH